MSSTIGCGNQKNWHTRKRELKLISELINGSRTLLAAERNIKEKIFICLIRKFPKTLSVRQEPYASRSPLHPDETLLCV